jgi:hypothetical protein
MQSEKQKLLIEYLVSSSDVLLRCLPILKAEYFDPEYRSAIKIIIDYVKKYNAPVPLEIINIETNLKLKKREVGIDQYGYACEEIEKFVKNEAVRIAIETSIPDIQDHKYESLVKKVHEATAISLEMDMGIDLFENIERNLLAAVDSLKYHPCGIQELDERLGGFARKQLTLFSANSGVGKSVMLSNLGFNYACMGYHVLYISLELSQEMINVRNSVIGTELPIKDWKENIHLMASRLEEIKERGAGSYIAKRMPSRVTNASHIRSYIKQYQLKYKRLPDVLIVDYLDLMGTDDNGRKAGWELEIQKSEDLYEVGVFYDMIMFTASQQNKAGLDDPNKQDGSVLAGAIAKVNIVDNHISLFMNLQMRLDGILMAKYHKTRSAGAAGQVDNLSFNSSTLQISSLKHKKSAQLSIREILAARKNTIPENISEPPEIIVDFNSVDDNIEDEKIPRTSAEETTELYELLTSIEGMT